MLTPAMEKAGVLTAMLATVDGKAVPQRKRGKRGDEDSDLSDARSDVSSDRSSRAVTSGGERSEDDRQRKKKNHRERKKKSRSRSREKKQKDKRRSPSPAFSGQRCP